MQKADKNSIDIIDRATVSLEDRAEMIDVLQSVLRKAEYGQLTLKIPKPEGRLQKRPDMHFHFKPEVFVQLHGVTSFECPNETVRLLPSEVGVMPSGVPHHEEISSGKQAFRNLVIGYYSNAISVHFAYEIADGKPEIEVIEFYDAPNLELYLNITNSLVEAYHKKAPVRDRIVKGLTISLFALILNVVELGNSRMNQDIGKVFMVKWLVREQISNTKLNVKALAKKIRCSPDYLSHHFHEQTGEKLVHYIQRIRVEGAMLALSSSPLYISEIAWASGFSDPAYFARVFKKITGISPQDFRNQQDAKRKENENAPKTIYYDREDYSAGQAH